MTRDALPTFEQRSAELTLLYWGGTTATGTLLGQVESFNWTDGINTREGGRLGDSTVYETFTSHNVSWDLSLHEDDTMKEPALILGTTQPTAGGWLGSEDITLSLTQAGATVTVASYDGEATTSSLLWTETLAVVKVKEVNPARTQGDANMWSFSGRADTVTVEPAAGVGA